LSFLIIHRRQRTPLLHPALVNEPKGPLIPLRPK
jgi:hypothetical protein